MPKVKICGVTRLLDIQAINAEKPDYVGFVFAKSRRQVTPAQALGLRNALVPGITTVGVFVDEPAECICDLVQRGVIDIIQLHGNEDENYIASLKSITNKPIIKAIAVQAKGDVQKWNHTSADYLLLDSKGGGTGLVFDWGLIGETTKPYFLAGGLKAENVSEAIRKTTPYAIDVSSGVETDGLKDAAKIKDLIRRVRHEW